MSPDVLRRKLQKKKKRKPYGKCPLCGHRMEKRVVRDHDKDSPTLLSRCKGRGCGHTKEYTWSGGGTGRHIG